MNNLQHSLASPFLAFVVCATVLNCEHHFPHNQAGDVSAPSKYLSVSDNLHVQALWNRLKPVELAELEQHFDHDLDSLEDTLAAALAICLKRKQYLPAHIAAQMLIDHYKAQCNFEAALRYKEVQLALRDSVLSQEGTAAYAMQRENELLAQRTWGVTVILFLLFALAFYIFRLRAVQEKQRLQAERAQATEYALRLVKELEIAHLEAEANKNRLADYTQMLIERNNQINELSQKLEQSAFAQTASPNSTFDLFQQVILTESHWELFQQYFNSVYPGYIAELRLHWPNLKPAEMRFILLGKMGLSLKETAAILGISIDAVKKGRYRLKKKYGLEGINVMT